MKQKYMGILLKYSTIGIGIIAIFTYFNALPKIGNLLVAGHLESLYWPWITFLWGSSIPCFLALLCFWNICCNIKSDESFSTSSSKLLNYISILAFIDVIYFFMGNMILYLLGMNHIYVLFISFMVDFVGVTIGIAAATLSKLVLHAAKLKEESAFTI